MLDALIAEFRDRFKLGDKAQAVVAHTLAQVVDPSSGGLAGFLKGFRDVGLGHKVDSWASGDGKPLPLDAREVEKALTPRALRNIAADARLLPGVAAGMLGYLLPRLLPKLIAASKDNLKTPPAWVADYLPTGEDDVPLADEGLPAVPPVEAVATIPPAPLAPAAPHPAPQPAAVGATGDLAPSPDAATPEGGSFRKWAVGLGALIVVAALAGRLVMSPAPEPPKAGPAPTAQPARPEAPAAAPEPLKAETPAPAAPRQEAAAPAAPKPEAPRAEPPKVEAPKQEPAAQPAAKADIVPPAAQAAAQPAPAPASPAAAAPEPAPAAASPAKAAQPAMQPAQMLAAANRTPVTFDFGSSTISPEAAALLDQTAEALKALPAGTRIEVGGHTDSAGDVAANQLLSLERAEAVRAYLVGKGVDGRMLTARGYGRNRPADDNQSAEGRARNRRIEFGLMK